MTLQKDYYIQHILKEKNIIYNKNYKLVQSATVPAYNDAIRSIETCLNVALQAKELADFWPTVREVEDELKKLEVGEIMKRQFSCDKLYKQLIITAVEEIEKN